MKICYDNEDRIVYKNDKFYIIQSSGKNCIYYYHEYCKECGDEFIDAKKENAKFCCKKCRSLNSEYKAKQSEIQKEVYSYPELRAKQSEKAKKYWSDTEARAKASERTKKQLSIPENNPAWKGGYHSNNQPRFDLLAPKLEPYGERCERDPINPEILNSECYKCKQMFRPTLVQVYNRIKNLESGTCRFYCSQECKNTCDIVNRSPDQIEAYALKQYAIQNGIIIEEIKATSPKFRKMVLELDDYTCQLCYATENLNAHHDIPKSIDPELMDDPNNGITVCFDCHMRLHMEIEGCGLCELRKRAQERRELMRMERNK